MARRLAQTVLARSSVWAAPRFCSSTWRRDALFCRDHFHHSTVPSLLPKQQPWILSTVQHYAKRRHKNPNDPCVYIKVGEDEPCPVSQPNKGSVKNRNQKKRMEQRHAFRKEEVRKRIASCKAAKARKLKLRRQRWKEAGDRVRAWAAKKVAEAKEAEAQQQAVPQ